MKLFILSYGFSNILKLAFIDTSKYLTNNLLSGRGREKSRFPPYPPKGRDGRLHLLCLPLSVGRFRPLARNNLTSSVRLSAIVSVIRASSLKSPALSLVTFERIRPYASVSSRNVWNRNQLYKQQIPLQVVKPYRGISKNPLYGII